MAMYWEWINTMSWWQICLCSSAAGIQALDRHWLNINPTRQCLVTVKTNTSDSILNFNNERITVKILLAEHRVLDSIYFSSLIRIFLNYDYTLLDRMVTACIPILFPLKQFFQYLLFGYIYMHTNVGGLRLSKSVSILSN